MSKSILFALLVSAVTAFASGSAFARGAHRGYTVSQVVAAPSCAATAANVAPVTPTSPHAGMHMSQGNSRSMYQSFSYEPTESQPGVNAQPVTTPARQMFAPSNRTYRQSPSFYDTVRGDRKVRAQYGLQ